MLMQNIGVRNKEHYGMLWYFLEWSIRHSHVVVMLRRQRNVQKRVIHVQSCCFTNINLLFFAILVDIAIVVAYAPYFHELERH